MKALGKYCMKTIYFIKIYCVILPAWKKKSQFAQTPISSST